LTSHLKTETIAVPR